MDEQNTDFTSPHAPDQSAPETTAPIDSTDEVRVPSVPNVTTEDGLSFSSIHDTLSEFHTQMKDVLTPENFERRLREKRRNLYTKYIQQEVGDLASFDHLSQSITHHGSLLSEAAKNDVFRAILLEDVMKRVDTVEQEPIKNAQDKLQLVRQIYDEAEKVAPEIGGVTPEWAVRKRREIRGGLARDIIADEKNTPAVTSYLNSFEQYELNKISADDPWKDGDVELARHLRQVLREKEKGELTTSPAVIPEEEISTPVVSDYVRPMESPSVASSPIVPEPVAVVAPEPVAESPESELPPIRKDADEINKSINYSLSNRLAQVETPALGNFFAVATGINKGSIPSVTDAGKPDEKVEEFSETSSTDDFTIPYQPDPGVIEPEVVAKTEEKSPFVTPDSDPEPTLAQVINEDQELIQTVEPHEVNQPIVSIGQSQDDSHVQDSEHEPEVEKKKGFLGRLFGR